MKKLGFLKRGIILIAMLVAFYQASTQENIESIQFHFEQASLTSIIQLLEKHYPITFSYDTQLTDSFEVDGYFAHTTVKELIFAIMADKPLEAIEVSPISPHSTRHFLLLPPKQKKSEVKIEGFLSDQNNQKAIPFVNIWVPSSQIGTQSDDNGYFQIKLPHPTDGVIAFSCIGYQDTQIPISQFLSVSPLSIVLSSDTIDISPVLIEGQIIEALQTEREGKGFQFQPAHLKNLPGWGANDVLRMGQLIPGIAATNELAGAINIRGNLPHHNLIYFDEIPVYHSGHLQGFYSAFNPKAVANFKVYRGSYGAQHGGRVAGFIDIQGFTDSIQHTEVDIGLSSMIYQAKIQHPIGRKSALLLTGRKSLPSTLAFNRPFEQNLVDNKIAASNSKKTALNEWSMNTNFSFYDWNLKFVHQLSTTQQLSLSVLNNYDVLDYKIAYKKEAALTLNDHLVLQNSGLSTIWKNRWNKHWHSKIVLAFSNYQRQYQYRFQNQTNPNLNRGLEQRNQLREWNLKLHQQWQINSQIQLNGGYQQAKLRIAKSSNSTFPKQTQSRTIHSLYLDTDWRHRKKWRFDLGLRYNTLARNNYWAWRSSFSWQLKSPHLFLKGNAGRHFQFINQVINPSPWGSNEQIWQLATGELEAPVIEANKAALGLQYHTKQTLIEAEYYFQNTSGISTRNVIIERPFDYALDFGSSLDRGLDFLFKQKFNAYQFWLAYSLFKVDYQFPQKNGSITFAAPNDRRHTLKWTHFYNGPKWNASLTWHFYTGLPYTDFAQINTTENQHTINTSRLPNYHRLDLSASRIIEKTGRHWQAKIGLGIFNVYHQKNLSGYHFLVTENNNRDLSSIIQLQRRHLGFTPSLFFEWRWKK